MSGPIEPDLLPWSLEAEQSVLGALMLDPAALDRAEHLERKHFCLPIHGWIFEACAKLVAANKAADLIAVHEVLRNAGRHEEVGGLAYLNDLAQSVPSALNVRLYADIVREKAAQRALIEVADQALSIAKGKGAVADKIDSISAMLGQLQRAGMRKTPHRLGELLADRVDIINALGQGELSAGWLTHIPKLNRMLGGGLRAGGQYVIAARPSVGKSSYSEDLGLHLASNGVTVLMLSQEMPEAEVVDRALTNLGRIDYERLQTGQLHDHEWGLLTDACVRAADLPFYVDDQPALRLSDIRAKARQTFGSDGGVLILDYLQLCSGPAREQNRNAEIEEISRGLKALAKDMRLAVVVLSQLNRAVENRSDKRPNLSDLRDSGAIEQDADVVMFLWSARDFEINDCRIIGCEVAKNRQGKRGEFCLDFHGATQSWHESDHEVRAPEGPMVMRRPAL